MTYRPKDKLDIRLKKSFTVTLSDMRRIIKDFHKEMAKGLSRAKGGSLKMIPTFVPRPTGEERGSFLALDLGGTNFRVIEAELKGGGKSSTLGVKNFALKRKYITGSGEALFDFIAGCISDFIKTEKIRADDRRDLGFTFSFPVNQTDIASGTLVKWTKGFCAKGVIGQDVVRLLSEALARRGRGNIRITALVNDTVGTLVAGSYEDPSCDVGVIIGTGTNACYLEGGKIINIEWGNFNRLKRNLYDRELDKESENPSHQILEKMVSGMYLGELARLVLKGLAGKGFARPWSFKTEDISNIESGRSKHSSIVREVCELVSTRSSRVAAAALAAVVTKMDPGLSARHTIAIDGSVYEKHPRFARRMRSALKEIFGSRASNIKLVLTKDGSGKGAAIIAAIAAKESAL